jgi:hypothetical protein
VALPSISGGSLLLYMRTAMAAQVLVLLSLSFWPLLLAFNYGADAPKNDEKLIPSAVLMVMRVVLVALAVFFLVSVAFYVYYATVSHSFYSAKAASAAICSVFSFVLLCFFHAHPKQKKTTTRRVSNSPSFVAIIIAVFAFGGIVFAVVIEAIAASSVALVVTFGFSLGFCFLLLLCLPIWIATRNVVGGLSRSHYTL